MNTMKIQKQLSKKWGDKKYYKYVIVVPSNKVKEAGLKKGDKLETKAEKNKLVLEKKWAENL